MKFIEFVLVVLEILLFEIVSPKSVEYNKIIAQIPPMCRRPPAGIEKFRPKDCCEIVDPVPKNVYIECNAIKKNSTDKRPCAHELCIMKRANLLNDDESLSISKTKTFLDKYARDTPDFEAAAVVAKTKCLSDDILITSGLCHQIPTMTCIASTIFMECPNWKYTPTCNSMRNHYNQCVQYQKLLFEASN